MGLDMYLTKNHYVKNWGHQTPAERHVITIKKGGKKSPIDAKRIGEVVTDEIYWRKANAIHNWFVKNCQDGVDDCQKHHVSTEQLKELLRTVTSVLEASKLVPGKINDGTSYTPKGGMKTIIKEGKVIADSRAAEALLPAASGFFFGSTEYNQYYYEDLVRTKKELERVLEAKDDGEFYYQSSW
jgi:hypothetical protein